MSRYIREDFRFVGLFERDLVMTRSDIPRIESIVIGGEEDIEREFVRLLFTIIGAIRDASIGCPTPTTRSINERTRERRLESNLSKQQCQDTY